MKNARLLLPLFAVTLGACGTYAPMVNDDQSKSIGQKVANTAATKDPLTTLSVEPTTRISNGVSEDRAAYLTGKSLLAEHKTDAAIDSFAKALSLNPKMVDAYVGIGIAQSMANRQPLAIAAFGEAVRLEPGKAQWRANLGMAMARNGEFQKANQELSKAWAMAPSNRRIEAQYQRVAETARLERIVAEQAAARQAQIDASGMTVVTAESMGSGMRQVNKRVYELDLEPKAATPVVAYQQVSPVSEPAVSPQVTTTSTTLPPLVAAEPDTQTLETETADNTITEVSAVNADVIKPSESATENLVEDKQVSPMLPPAIQITRPEVKPVTASVEQVVISDMPAKARVADDQSIQEPVKSTMSASMLGATAIGSSEQMIDQANVQANVQTIETVQETEMPLTLSAEQIAKAEAELTRNDAPASSIASTEAVISDQAKTMETMVETADQQEPAVMQTPETAFESREEALALARQRLFERKLERARIRAAKTARIGLEDQAQN
ncbi:MAG: hypothetical protein AB8C46_13360 [Burkholderiaceae bacterium]